MYNSEQENCNRCRRRLGLKHGLTVLCLVAFANLSGAQNYNSQFNFNFNISPYPWAKTNSESIQEKNVTVEKISDDKKNYCFKPECIHTASRILNYMDESLDPCDNFYEFACGQYMREHEKSNVFYEDNNLIYTQKKINQKLKNILEKKLEPTEPKYVKLMKTFYGNCMNSNDTEELISTAMWIISEKLDRLSSETEISIKNESWHWEKFQAEIMKLTNLLPTAFFKLDFMYDTKNNSNTALWIQQPSDFTTTKFTSINNMFPELLENNVRIKNFSDIIQEAEKMRIKIQQTSNITTSNSKFNNYIRQKNLEKYVQLKKNSVIVLEIEKMLINISIPEDDRKRHNFERISVKELEGNYSNILWREIFNGMLHPTTEVRDDDIVLVSDRSYFEKLNEQINNISKKGQVIYILMTLSFDMAMDVTLQKYENKELWEKCIDSTRDSFINALDTFYVKNYVNEETSNKHIDELITNIFHQFNIIIKNMDWLDKKTKDYALEKLSSLYAERQTIYQISDDREYDEFFTNLEITEGDFYESIMNVTKFIHEVKTRSYRVPLNASSFLVRSDATKVNALNELNLNSFGISPRYFRGIFFNESRPMYMNYGAIGTIAGHEFTHDFESLGKHYVKNENLNDWWELRSQKQFAEKVQCFISQYKNYKNNEANLNVNDIRTLRENIADNAGLKVSYSAYQKWVKDHGSEPLLPGLNYTQSQLFWISYAQAFCHKGSLKYQKSSLETDEYNSPEFRIIGSLSNRPEFANDFQCSVGSKMNSTAKCSV